MTPPPQNAGALDNLCVLEIGSGIAASYCGKLLADLGADVIKLEPVGGGDSVRRLGPFRDDIPDQEGGGLHLFLNTNKRSATLNRQSKAGQRLTRELAAKADALLITLEADEEPSAMLATLTDLPQNLVVVAITPFGLDGPFSLYRGGRLIGSHASGIAYMNPAEGVADLPTEPPLQAPGEFAELTTGITAGLGALAALLTAQAGMGGSLVDVSEQEALASAVRTEMAAFTYEKDQPDRMKMRKRSGGMLYECKDGFFVMSATGDGFWAALVEMMAAPAWTNEDWCQTSVQRHTYIEKVNSGINEWAAVYTALEIEAMAIAKRIPFGIVKTVAALVDDAQLAERDFFVAVPHPQGGELSIPGAPYKLSGTAWALRRPAPRTGEHNAEIYCNMLGYDRAALVRMRQSNVI